MKILSKVFAVILTVSLLFNGFPAFAHAAPSASPPDGPGNVIETGRSDGIWTFDVTDAQCAVVTGYADAAVCTLAIPRELGGLPVTGIGGKAFAANPSLTSVTIPGSILWIAGDAFEGLNGLTVCAYNGSEALRYAEAHAIASRNLSRFDFVDGVIDLSDLPSDAFAYRSETQIRLPPQDAKRLSPGGVFYLPPDKAHPQGAAWKLLSSSDTGDGALLDCETAEVDAILKKMSFSAQNVQPDWKAVSPCAGVVLESQKAALSDPVSRQIQLSFSKGPLSGTVKLTGTTQLVTAEFDADFTNRKINKAKWAFEDTWTVDVNLNTQYQGDFEIALLHIPFQTTGIETLEAELTLSGTVSASGAIKWTVTADYGAEWVSAQQRFVGSMTLQQQPPDLSFTADATAQLNYGVGIDILFLGDVFTLSEYVGLDCSLNTEYTFPTDGGSTVTCSDFTVDYIDGLRISARLFFLEKQFDLMSDRVQLLKQHFENGIPVSKCTRMATVKFVSNSGLTIQDASVPKGSTVAAPSPGSRAGYEFEGWYVNGTLSSKWDFSRAVTADMTLVALWTNVSSSPGSGLVYTYNKGLAGVTAYSGNDQNLIIPAKISTPDDEDHPTSEVGYVNDSVFSNCNGLTSISLPSTVKSFGYIENCANLQSIGLPNGIEYVGGIKNCRKLTSLSYPSSVTACTNVTACMGLKWVTIAGPIAFLPSYADCINLESISFPSTVTSIGRYTNCAKLKSFTVPNGVTQILNMAFFGCSSLTGLDLPNTVTSIGDNAFGGSGLTHFTIPASVTNLGPVIFCNCYSLKTLEFAGSRTSLPNIVSEAYAHTFVATGIERVILPSGITSIPERYFYGMGNLTTIDIPSSVGSIGESAFEKCYILKSITIPGSVAKIEKNTFCDCVNLQYITLPAGLTGIGDGAFCNCHNLREIVVPQSVTAIGTDAFYNCGMLKMYGYRDSAAEQYAEANNITFIALDGGDLNVAFDTQGGRPMPGFAAAEGAAIPLPVNPEREGYVFTGWFKDAACAEPFDFSAERMPSTDMTLYAGWSPVSEGYQYFVWDGYAGITKYTGGESDVSIPDAINGIPVNNICDYAFSGLDGITAIHIPASVQWISGKAFYGCDGLAAITVDTANPYLSSEGGILYDKQKTVLIRCPQAAASGPALPDTLTRIGDYAFMGCGALAGLAIPSGVYSIGAYAFSDCPSLGKLVLPAGLAEIGAGAFSGSKSVSLYGPVADCAARQFAADHWIPYNRYTVTYYDAGQKMYSVQVMAGELLPPPVPFERTGTQAQWYTDTSCSTVWDYASGRMPEKDMSLYARWYSAACTVSFDSRGGNAVASSAVSCGSVVPEPASPTRAGYAFRGWFRDAGCTNIWNFATETVTADITLYAGWSAEIYTIGYDLGGSASPANPASYTVESAAITLVNPTRTGYTFAGWSGTGISGTAASVTIPAGSTGNRAYTACWTAIEYAVTFISQGGSAVPGIPVQYGSTVPAPAAPARPNFNFKGWYREPACVNAWNFSADIVTDNITLYARWTAQTPGAYLSGIKLSAGTLSHSFKATVTSYTVNLREGDKGVTVTPVNGYDKAAMTINGAKVKSRTVTVANGKSATVTVKLTNGKTSKTYRLTIKRPKSTNNRLASLKASAGTLSPAFDPAKAAYTLTLPEKTGRVTITAVKASGLASVTPASKAYTLKPGQSVKATVKVKSQSGATRTYTVTIRRAKSTNAKLASLKTNVGTAPLTPIFKSGTNSYTVTLPAKTASVTLGWKAADALAKTYVNGKAAASFRVSLKSGQSRTVTVVVKAQAGNAASYTVVVRRP